MNSSHNEQLYDLYSSPDVIRVMKQRRMRWVGQVAPTGNRRGAYMVLGGGEGKPEGKRPFGRPRSIWEHNIKMYLQEVGWG